MKITVNKNLDIKIDIDYIIKSYYLSTSSTEDEIENTFKEYLETIKESDTVKYFILSDANAIKQVVAEIKMQLEEFPVYHDPKEILTFIGSRSFFPDNTKYKNLLAELFSYLDTLNLKNPVSPLSTDDNNIKVGKANNKMGLSEPGPIDAKEKEVENNKFINDQLKDITDLQKEEPKRGRGRPRKDQK